jgi:hypothetical protein
MSKINKKEEEIDGNSTLEEIYGKIQNIKLKEEESEQVEEEVNIKNNEEEKGNTENEEDENVVFKNKLKKHKNFDKRGQKFNKSKNRTSGNKRYETYDNDY